MNEILSIPPLHNIGKEMPVGMITPYIGLGDAPDGWLDCDGSAVNRNQYRDLFNLIGTAYGEGDGSTTFNLPNFNGKFLEGNATPGTVKEAGLPNITGQFSVQGNSNTNQTRLVSGSFYSVGGTRGTYNYTQANNASSQHTPVVEKFDASRSSAVYGNSDTVQPPAVTVRYLVKY